MSISNTKSQKHYLTKTRENLVVTGKLLQIASHIALGSLLILTLGFWISHRRPFQHRVIQWWHQRTCRILNLRLHVSGTPPTQPSLLVSNHVSWLDIIVVGGNMPLRFLSKAEVRQWPIIGWLAACTGTLFIKRGSGKSSMMADTIASEINAGESILVFPEATSTNGKQVRTFFPNMFEAAIKANSPVHPILLQYKEKGQHSDTAPFIGDDEFLTHLIRLLKSDGIDVRLSFLDAIEIDEESDKKSLSRASHNRIVTALITQERSRLSLP